MNDILYLEPIKKFIAAIGEKAQEYFGKDPSCIIYLRPDGTFYGVGLYQWLKKKHKNLTLTTMEDDGEGLEESKVKGRKVLVVDNDIITGKGYKRSMEALRLLKEKLHIKEVKFAVFSDRAGIADFSVAEYSAGAVWNVSNLDALDLKIISYLAQDGRESFVEIAKKLQMSGVAVKNRVDRLFKWGILKISGSLRSDRFYTMSAAIQIDAERKTLSRLIERFEKIQEVHHLVKRSGSYNLSVGILVHNLEDIEKFVENQIRSEEGIRSIDVRIGELPIVPKTFSPQS